MTKEYRTLLPKTCELVICNATVYSTRKVKLHVNAAAVVMWFDNTQQWRNSVHCVYTTAIIYCLVWPSVNSGVYCVLMGVCGRHYYPTLANIPNVTTRVSRNIHVFVLA